MHDTTKKLRHKTPSSAKRARSASATAEGARPDKGRWSSRLKSEIVLRILRSETLDALGLELGVTPGTLTQGCDDAWATPMLGGPRCQAGWDFAL
jgi:hypothetical protein